MPEPLIILHHLVCGFVAGVFKCKVNHGVLQSPAHVKLKGEVIHPLQDKTGKTTIVIHSNSLYFLQCLLQSRFIKALQKTRARSMIKQQWQEKEETLSRT